METYMTREQIKRHFQIGASVGLLLASTAQTALAQSETAANKSFDYAIEEVVVTARKRAESVQETPIAITAFSASQLEARSLTNLVETAAYIPNVVMNVAPRAGGGGSNMQIYIRGIGQEDFLFTTDPGVGVYVDGVYHPRSLGGVKDLLDLERVEVLRGPQGTLFGKNTMGGAISMTSKKPRGDGSGYLEATTGRFNRLDVRGSFDVALGDDLAAILSVSSKNRDGYGKVLEFGTDKVIDERGDENETSARLALRWKPSGDIVVDLSADYTRGRERSVPNTLIFFDDANEFGGLGGLWNALVGAPNGQIMSSDLIIDDPYDSYSNAGDKDTLDAYGVALTVDWALAETLSLKSITAYREMDAFFSNDTDGTQLAYLQSAQAQDQDQISQEFQLLGSSFDGRLDWVMGLFYFDEYGRDQNEVRLATGLYDALEALPGPLNGSPLAAPTAPGGPGNPINVNLDLALNPFNEIDIKSYAAFTQGSYHITDSLSVTAGARYSYEEKSYLHSSFRTAAQVFSVSPTLTEDNWSSFTPMGSVEYKVNDDALVYGSVTKGFKSGGFNGRPTGTGFIESFSPEKVLSYEVGFKTDWADNRLRLNGAVFYSDYTDMQMGSISADADGVLVLRIQNAGKARIKGFELEMQARPVAGLDIIGSLGYVDFQIKELDPGVVDFNLDTRAMKTPKWNSSLGLQYSWDLASNGSLSIRGDWTYQSKTYQDIQNTELIASDGYSLFNARMVYTSPSADWEAALFCTNLTDKVYVTNAYQTLRSFGTANVLNGRPREWGLSIQRNF
jgi:iron complex outermembrane receptor protein